MSLIVFIYLDLLNSVKLTLFLFVVLLSCAKPTELCSHRGGPEAELHHPPRICAPCLCDFAFSRMNETSMESDCPCLLSLSGHAVPFTSRLCLGTGVSPLCLVTHLLKGSWIVYLGVKLPRCSQRVLCV